MTAVRQAPGPKGHFLLGNLPDFGRDMLGFVDRIPYDQRLAEEQAKTGMNDAAVSALGAPAGRGASPHFSLACSSSN